MDLKTNSLNYFNFWRTIIVMSSYSGLGLFIISVTKSIILWAIRIKETITD